MSKRKLASLLITVAITSAAGATLKSGTPRTTALAQDGELSRKQKEHGKLYKGYGAGEDLRERVKKRGGDVEIVETQPIPFELESRPPFLDAIACDADAVVIGVLQDESPSQLTEGGEFVYTDYSLAVEEVIKDNAAVRVEPGQVVTVSRPGGEVKFDGKTIRAVDESFTPFALRGRYVLFLRFVPSTGGYRAFANGSFRLKNGEVLKPKGATPAASVPVERSAFVGVVRHAAASTCPPAVKALD
jgi:hypothetical protein